MKTILALMVAAAAPLPVALAGELPPARDAMLSVDEAIVFAADVSWSMDAAELRIVREGHASAITAPEVIAAISRGSIGRIAATYVEFAGEARQKVGWTLIDGQAAAERFAAAIRAVTSTTEAYTDIGAALYLAGDLLDRMPYQATSRVVDIVGDGVSGSTIWLTANRDVLVGKGIVINGLPMVIRPSEAGVAGFYDTMVIGGPGAFSLPITRIEQMPSVMRRKIERELY